MMTTTADVIMSQAIEEDAFAIGRRMLEKAGINEVKRTFWQRFHLKTAPVGKPAK